MTRRETPARRIRVVHVVRQLDVGGMENLLVEFARHADRSRFNLRFVSLTTRGVLAADIESCGWPVTALEQPPGLRAGLPFRLAGLLRRWKANVVHTHNTAALLYAAPAARMAGVAGVIHTRHGQNYQSGRRQRAAFRLASQLADRVVCVSADSAIMSASEGVPRSRLRVLRNGIDLFRFEYRGPCPSGPAVMVARLSPEKDAANLLRAAAIVARKWPAFQLEIAGDGRCLPELRRLAGQLGLAASVTFLGQVRDVPAVLERASLFVLPSLSEGVSLTLLEAMARGLPIVATRVGGTPEVVLDGVTGFLVPAADPAALADRIERLLANPQSAQMMGRAGRRRVEEAFDIVGMVGQYEVMYGRLARRHSVLCV
jgi:glycosyltransferase involved in cell wall biosynthesis